MTDPLFQEAINLLASLLTILFSFLSVWLVGKYSGLWALIENELIRRAVHTGLRWVISYDVNDNDIPDSEEFINRVVQKSAVWAEDYLNSRGINVELDKLEAVALEAIEDMYDFVTTKVSDVDFENMNAKG